MINGSYETINSVLDNPKKKQLKTVCQRLYQSLCIILCPKLWKGVENFAFDCFAKRALFLYFL